MEYPEFQDSEDSAALRKRQKAGREKKRRDQLNEQFIHLGKTLDAERPKNDKATILNDTIQLLKELTAEVEKLKAEHAALTEESHELTQEKTDLREEKANLKLDVERLNGQCQQRLGSNFPWAAPDSILPHPPSYPYPMPMAFPAAPMPMHPSMQPYPFFGSPNPGMFPNPCAPFIPCVTHNPPAQQPSTQYVSPSLQQVARTEVSGRQAARSSSVKEIEKQIDKSADSNDIATDLELKTPGSITDEDTSPGGLRCRKPPQNKIIAAERSPSSRWSSHSVQDSSSDDSDSVVGGGKAND